MSTEKLNQIEELLSELSSEEQLLLIEHMANRLRGIKSDATKYRHWREFRGLGKEIWQGIDVNKYIKELRDEWES